MDDDAQVSHRRCRTHRHFPGTLDPIQPWYFYTRCTQELHATQLQHELLRVANNTTRRSGTTHKNSQLPGRRKQQATSRPRKRTVRCCALLQWDTFNTASAAEPSADRPVTATLRSSYDTNSRWLSTSNPKRLHRATTSAGVMAGRWDACVHGTVAEIQAISGDTRLVGVRGRPPDHAAVPYSDGEEDTSPFVSRLHLAPRLLACVRTVRVSMNAEWCRHY